MSPILQQTPHGLYCAAGDFYIDPRLPVESAVITHAHADHARLGCRRYLAAQSNEHLLRMRLAADADLTFAAYGTELTVGGVRVSLHPAGHMLGSAQVRLEHRGQVAVVTGDYKLGEDATCSPWTPIRCHHLVTESTFGLPIYRWQSQQDVFAAINHWWRENRAQGLCSVLFSYAIGKSQRILAGIDASIGPIYTHGAVEKGCQAYRASGVNLPHTTHVAAEENQRAFAGSLVVAVPSAHGSPWLRRFRARQTAMVSGWMAVRGPRRRRHVDRGFALSDHVDWPSLLQAVEACSPERVWVTHGYAAVVARYLTEMGRQAEAIDEQGRQEENTDQFFDRQSETEA